MSTQWIPNYIRREINYKPNDVLSAQEYNAILNLIITQGDYNSSWLQYLQTEGIPDAIENISIEQIQAAITAAVREEIAALTSAVVNKTSKQLNNPMVSILNIGMLNSGIANLKTLLEAKSLNATFVIATNLVGYNSSYPSLAQLNTLKNAGNDIVAYSTDAATITTGTMETVVPAAQQFMHTNGFNEDVFVYPNGNSSDVVRDYVCSLYDYAVNISTEGVIVPDGIIVNSPASVRGNIAVVPFDSTVDIDDIKDIIDDIVEHNKYLILLIDTSSVNYSSENLATVFDYLLTKVDIVYPSSISDAMHTIHATIGNTLATLDGITITEVGGVKYINW